MLTAKDILEIARSFAEDGTTHATAGRLNVCVDDGQDAALDLGMWSAELLHLSDGNPNGPLFAGILIGIEAERRGLTAPEYVG